MVHQIKSRWHTFLLITLSYIVRVVGFMSLRPEMQLNRDNSYGAANVTMRNRICNDGRESALNEN